MTELYIPTHQDPEVVELRYKRSETFRRRSVASKNNMLKYWADGRHHRRVDPQAKAVDVFDMDGHYLATYPSSRKAAVALGIPRRLENCIRAIRRGDPDKKSCHGYMFRDAAPVKADIEPYAVKAKTQKRGYHKDNSYLCKAVRVIFQDGDIMDFQSVKECADALGRKQNSVSYAANHGTRCRGFRVQFIENQLNKC